MFLELDVAVLILTQVEEQFLDLVAESDVVGILGHVIEESVDFINDTIGVLLVAVIEEVLALLVDAVPFLGGFIFEDVSVFAETFANVSIETFPPVGEFGIIVGICDEVIDGIEDIVHGCAVSKVLEERLELGLCFLEVVVLSCAFDFAMGVLGDGTGVSSVFLSETDECVNGLLVILMLLDFDHHLLQTMDGLIATFLRDFVIEIILGLILGILFDFTSFVLVFVRDSVGDAILGRLSALFSASFLVDVTARSLVGVFVCGTSTSFFGVRLTCCTLSSVALDTVSVILSLIFGILGFGFILVLQIAERWRSFVPLMVWRGFVNLFETILVGTKFAGSLCASVGGHIAS